VLIPQIYTARRFNIDLAQFPHVKQAGESAASHPGLDAAAPENQPDAPVHSPPHAGGPTPG
jgi:hypothetical protein